MSAQTGFRNRGDQYLYIESDTNTSLAFGADVGTGTFNINTSSSIDVEPGEATSNFAIDPGANGDIVFQPNGTGTSVFSAGDVSISTGNLNIVSGNLLLAGVSGNDGQILIGNTGGNPTWGSITSTDASVTITEGPNTLDLSVAGGGGGGAETFITDSGTATESGGFLNVVSGGVNIATSGAGSTVTITLENDVTISGTYTSTAGNLALNSGSATISGTYTSTGGDLVLDAGNATISGTYTTTGGNVEVDAGDVILSGGNIEIPMTNAAGTEGVITQRNRRIFHTQTPVIDPQSNMFIGEIAGQFGLGSNSADNLGVGYTALGNIQTGSQGNTAIGMYSLQDITTGSENTFVGSNSAVALTTSDGNTGVGSFVLNDCTGSNNTALGKSSLVRATSSDSNTALGYQTLNLLATGDNNIAVGSSAGSLYTTSESSNIVIGNTGTGTDSNTIRIGTQGSAAGQQNKAFISGIYNITPSGGQDGTVVIDSNGQLGSTLDLQLTTLTTTGDIDCGGNYVLEIADAAQTQGYIEDPSGNRLLSFFYGDSSLSSQNVYLGYQSGNLATGTSKQNVGVGPNTLKSLSGTGASGNTAVGYNSMQNADAQNNTAVGIASLVNVQGNENVALGERALNQLAGAGASNTAVGRRAGFSYTTTESSNILLGADVNGTVGESNVLRIGAGTGTGTGQQNKAFISGIYNITPAGGQDGTVVIDSNGQLGSTLNPEVTSLTATGDIETTGGNLEMPATNTAFTAGTLTINGDRFLHSVGSSSNVFVGRDAGNASVTGTGVTAVGQLAGNSITSGNLTVLVGVQAGENITQGSGNVAIGRLAGNSITTGNNNVAIGQQCLERVTTSASGNIALGYLSGFGYTGTESDNICLGSSGVAGDNNTIRIGRQGTGGNQQDTAFIAGIYNVTPSGGQDGTVVIDSNGQLGSTLAPEVNSISFDSGTNALSAYTAKTSFTPALQFGGASTGITYSKQVGWYEQIGSTVSVYIRVDLTNKGTATGAMTITTPGVPRPVDSTALTCRVGNITFQDVLQGGKNPGSDDCVIEEVDNTTGSQSVLQDTNFANNSLMILTGTWII